MVNEFRDHAKPLSGRLVIGSCFRTWSAGMVPDSTIETFYLIAADGGFGSVDLDWIGGDLTEVCSVNVRPFKTKKKVGSTTFAGDEQYETFPPGAP